MLIIIDYISNNFPRKVVMGCPGRKFWPAKRPKFLAPKRPGSTGSPVIKSDSRMKAGPEPKLRGRLAHEAIVGRRNQGSHASVQQSKGDLVATQKLLWLMRTVQQ